ncbi:hypothetical protein [Cryptosporangium aurantiacum]|uniref:Uncharacterized protein n=1 Tax=Cryptosporangium aurantiacum TaxID=134849 RepID=A0A1M7TUW9_9ACTN|nr:hypothetical protein [Cryptosporangium aurantiacum]SHN74496.1 hypothetical protein SAMN05443668_10792 [Cryptosporangium aurantiacum]
MAENKAATNPRRGRLMLVVLLAVGMFAAVGSLAAAYVSGDDRQPAATATATASASPTASPMTSEEARAEFYRQHPRATGWWQWVLIGGLVALLAVIGWLLFTRPRPENRKT